jgi:hypothetical protein
VDDHEQAFPGSINFLTSLDSSNLFRQSGGMPLAPDWPRLAEHVIARRVALGYQHRRAFADAVGVSDRTLAKVEDGTSVGRSTLGALDNALKWAPGSASAILRGGHPTPAPGSHPQGRLGELLIKRRIEMDPAYAPRHAFADSVGLTEEFVADVEHGRMLGLTGEQQALIERAYSWVPGSVAAVLDGKEPAAIPNVTGSAYMSATTGTTVAAEASDVVMMDLRTPPDDVSDDVKALWNNYPIERRIVWHLPIPWYERELLQEYLHGMRAAVRRAQQEQRDRNGGSQAS